MKAFQDIEGRLELILAPWSLETLKNNPRTSYIMKCCIPENETRLPVNIIGSAKLEYVPSAKLARGIHLVESNSSAQERTAVVLIDTSIYEQLLNKDKVERRDVAIYTSKGFFGGRRKPTELDRLYRDFYYQSELLMRELTEKI